MSRRASRKKVNYSQFAEDAEKFESDDDFQDSPNQPPSKRSKAGSKGNKGKEKIIKETNPASLISKGSQVLKNESIRKSREEKQFEKELQAALELSKKDSPEVVLIESDDGHSDNFELTTKGSEVKKQQRNDEEVVEELVEDASDEGSADYDSKEYEISEDGDDDYSEHEDEEFVLEKKQSAPAHTQNNAMSKGKESNNVPKIKNEKAKDPPKAKSSKKTATNTSNKKHLSKTNLMHPTLEKSHTSQGAVVPRVGFKSPVGSSNTTTKLPSTGAPTLDSQNGKRKNGNFSTGVAAAAINSSKPSGLRLGLSRNIRVAKPLHSNITIK